MGDCIIIRTKFQAVIAKRMAETGLMATPVHVVQFLLSDSEGGGTGLSDQCRKFGPLMGKETVLVRSRIGLVGTTAYFYYRMIQSRLLGHRVFIANVDCFPFALALRALRGQKVYSFDDGSANVQSRSNSFLSTTPSNRKGVVGDIVRRIFPQGTSAFVRSRIARHCTIFPGSANIVPPDRLDEIDIDWSRLIEDADVDRFPSGVKRVFLGSLYPQLRNLGFPVSDAEVTDLENWSDLHLPHPRQAEAHGQKSSWMSKYPAEVVIGHYSRMGNIIVAHYNSSAALSFASNPNVRLVNLLNTPVSDLLCIPDSTEQSNCDET